MTTNIIKQTRVNNVDSLQKLVDGYTKYAATAPSVVLAGVTLKPGDIVAKLQGAIDQSKAVTSAAANWHSQIATERNVAQQIKPLLLLVRRTLELAYSSQLDALADFGVAPRKSAVVSPQTRAAAALKAKATRAARGTLGKKQKASITAPVVVTPTSASPIKSVTTAAGTTVTTAASTPSVTVAPTVSGASTAVPTAMDAATPVTVPIATAPAPTPTSSPPAPANTPTPATHS
jgi:hypothetical protein